MAIEGTIVMSQGLRKSLDSMYDARIPDKWLKISWESATLGFWYTELLERDHQFRQWCNHGRPRVFWMTGFFNPQGFLTAMRQVNQNNMLIKKYYIGSYTSYIHLIKRYPLKYLMKKYCFLNI